MRISDCSSYVCSSDLSTILRQILLSACVHIDGAAYSLLSLRCLLFTRRDRLAVLPPQFGRPDDEPPFFRFAGAHQAGTGIPRSEEHTSELQSLMRTSYAVFYLKKQNQNCHTTN